MKLFLVGPYPPPHGGISVHVAKARRQADEKGVPCRVLNTSRGAPPSPDYISACSALHFAFTLFRHALQGWTIHVHTNGHNAKSWVLAMLGGIAGKAGEGSQLTLHSGLVPIYLQVSKQRRLLAAMACRLHNRVICVSPRIEKTVKELGIPDERVSVMPAFQGVERTRAALPPALERWLAAHNPVLAATAGEDPVYGIDLLIQAVREVRKEHPETGCVLAGVAPRQSRFEELIQDAALSGDILMLGDIPHEQCVSLISRSDVFVRPTLADGDSISVREALTLEVPVVASDVAIRPPGVTTFRSGNAKDLVSKIVCVLQTPLRNCA